MSHGSQGRAITWIDGQWHEGNTPLMGAMTHSTWLASMIFDGARGIRGAAPDLDRHCARAIASARKFGLAPKIDAKGIEKLAWEGIAKMGPDAELYVRPLFWGEEGFLTPDPASTRFALTIHDAPLPPPTGFSACLSPFRRPSPETAPTDVKASCLYPNVTRMVTDAKARGFDNAVVLDLLGNVAEFASANLFIVKDGVAKTPALNGTFLPGITRARVIQLLRDAGVRVEETTLKFAEVRDADEVFQTGNYSKVMACTRVEDRHLQPGPITAKARQMYFDWAKTQTAPRA